MTIALRMAVREAKSWELFGAGLELEARNTDAEERSRLLRFLGLLMIARERLRVKGA